ncbi:ABC transporter permease [Solibacillus ferritrahens]|uniref:ABC transporter permease n=1 Tax=Solibacillus ferritrahens TaxID=3098620 RepID=UPI003008AFA1
MIIQVAKSFILESIRNTGVFLGNLLPAFIFIICSWICTISIKSSPETLDFMIKGQFFPISIMLLVFAFAFSSATIYLADLKANNTIHLLKRTNISPARYFLGIGLGVFLMMNLVLILLLTGYSFIISLSITALISIILICNFVLLAIYPLCFIVAGVVKNGKVAQSLLVPIMLVFMFSITMTSLFLTLNEQQPQDYYIYLIWNPMLYLSDTLQFQLNLNDQTWLPLYQYSIILTILCMVLSIFAKQIYIRQD